MESNGDTVRSIQYAIWCVGNVNLRCARRNGAHRMGGNLAEKIACRDKRVYNLPRVRRAVRERVGTRGTGWTTRG